VLRRYFCGPNHSAHSIAFKFFTDDYRSGSPPSAPRLPPSSRAARGKTATSRASMRACVTAGCGKLRSSSIAGRLPQRGQTARIARIQTASSAGVRASPRAHHRLRYADPLRRPRWRQRKLSRLTFHPDHSMKAAHLDKLRFSAKVRVVESIA